jgi:hypothetical protein
VERGIDRNACPDGRAGPVRRDRGDLARELMPRQAGVVREWVDALIGFAVGAADADGPHSDESFPRARDGLRDIAQLELLRAGDEPDFHS